MKSLPTLLKIAKRDVDLLQRALADQIGKRVELDDRIRLHDQTIVREQQMALRDYESARAYGGYAQAALAGKRALEAQGVAVDQEADRLRGLIAEAHIEMRKFERLLELEAERVRKAAEKAEDAELDEMAVLRSGRR